MSDRAVGRRQGPVVRWYPPLGGGAAAAESPLDRLAVPLAELASLINSGDITRDIDTLVDDPDLAV